MFIDSKRKQTYQCAQYKLKIVCKTRQQKCKNIFEKKIKFLGFHAVVLVKNFPLMYHSYIGKNDTVLTKLRWFLFSGYRQTHGQTDNKVSESSYGNMSANKKKLDVDPQRDDDASPMSTYRCMLRPIWMISALQHKSNYKSNPISNFFEKKKSNFLVPML